MNIRRDSENGRILHISGLPTEGYEVKTLPSVSIRITYTGDGNPLWQAITLDNVIIPMIVRALSTGEIPT